MSSVRRGAGAGSAVLEHKTGETRNLCFAAVYTSQLMEFISLPRPFLDKTEKVLDKVPWKQTRKMFDSVDMFSIRL